MATIKEVRGIEIIDSRGNPTVAATVVLDSGASGYAAAPSGASPGSREAVELRDKDPKRFGGKGVSRAVGHVNRELRHLLLGHDIADQAVEVGRRALLAAGRAHGLEAGTGLRRGGRRRRQDRELEKRSKDETHGFGSFG